MLEKLVAISIRRPRAGIAGPGEAPRPPPPRPTPPRTPEEAEAFRRRVFDNPLLMNRLISSDGKTTAIYVPLERGANGKAVADAIKAMVAGQGGSEKFYLGG